MKTIDYLLQKHNGIGSGFDYLRIFLALLVFNGHSGGVAHGRAAQGIMIVNDTASIHDWTSFQEPLYTLIVPAFFALSGFLVSGSAFRTRDTSLFIGFRILRIAPALCVEVFLSALVLGALYTTLPIREYFTSAGFYSYFLNIFGIVHFYLPGVFTANPIEGIVNNSLWTLPAEFYCYLIIGLLISTKLFYKERTFVVIIILSTLLLIAFAPYVERWREGGNTPTAIVIYYFFVGCLFYTFRRFVPVNGFYIVTALILAYLFTYFRLTMVTPFFLTYAVVSIGSLRMPELKFISKNDYSYGIYLYHFPICQAVIATWPSVGRYTIIFKLLCLALTLLFAFTSWHLIEKNALRLKKRFAKRGEQIAIPQIKSQS